MTTKRLKAHLVKETSIKENFNGLFNNIAEANIDSDNFTVSNVCLFGRRESANGRTYSDTAIDSIVKLSEGGKCFINHITKQEMKDRSGVRDLRDWVGCFESSRRDGEKVLSNLKVREAYWDLVKDIALMGPHGIGHSIDARIKVFQDDSGKESVVDVVALRSTDLVASAATTDNLFESAIIDNKENDDSAAEKYIKDMAKYEVDQILSSLDIEEGMLKDQEIKRNINRLTWDAEELIGSIMRDRETPVGEKKKSIIGVLNDLETEIKGLLSELSGSESKGDKNKMDLNEIMQDKTLWNEITQKIKEAEEYTNLKTNQESLETKVNELTQKVTTLESDNTKLTEDNAKLVKENKDKATELDAIKAAEAITNKRTSINKLIAEAQLPKEVVTDLWVEDLMSLQEKKDGDNIVTVESQVKQRIEERKKLTIKSGKVTGSGDEFDASESDTDDGKNGKKTTEEALETFSKALK